MSLAYLNSKDNSFFFNAQTQFDSIITHLTSEQSSHNEHGHIEQFINKEGCEILRHLLQGYLDLRASKEKIRAFVTSSSGEKLNHIRHHNSRKLTTLFGNVKVSRKSYSQRKCPREFPLDGELNLSKDQYSEGIKHRVIYEAINSSFDDSVNAIKRTTGAEIAKRQCLNLVKYSAQDFEFYYEQNAHKSREETQDILAITFDGKGIVMRPSSLRECTKKAAKKSKKLNSRLSAGEKKDRKRMAQVAAVYTTKANVRTADSIMKHDDNIRPLRTPPRNKRVWASVEREAETVIEEAFKEALARDPEQSREWVILVDGLPHQLRLIDRVMKRLNVQATIIMDFIHVLEYLWKAAWCFFDKGDEAVEKWIEERAIKILKGQCSQVARGLRISAGKRKVAKRDAINKCADYLLKNQCRLRYGEALAIGFPIASGVIEGACRHLINDRLDITGARWGLEGAEAILKLRSLKSSGDIDAYLDFHRKMSKKRNYDLD